MKPLDQQNLKKMIDEKYISVQKHPTADLWIYNYTQRTQFEKVWNNETLQCRGLILDKEGNVVARPFPKFFNLEEVIAQGEDLPAEEFTVQDKIDGSLGILYWIDDTPYLATRGSFTSDQAIKGTQILHSGSTYFDILDRNYTYLFEIIYPENRIVVDYKGREEIILLAKINTKTGEEGDITNESSWITGAEYLKGITDYKTLTQAPQNNKEGFVIKFKDGKRYKVKFEEYVRLHRLVTGVNARRIWDILRNNQPLDELLNRVPDEFFNWVKKTALELCDKYEAINGRVFKAFVDCEMNSGTRKEFALYAIKNYSDISNLIFARKDEKPLAPRIWKLLEPKHETPFRREI